MTILYGIANCDKVKKARKWLEDHGIPYTFHDFRKDGLTTEQVSRWYNHLQDSMINRRSTTWRNLPESERACSSQTEVVDLLVKHPTLIQRPVLEHREQILMNFSEASYADFLNQGISK